MTLYETAVNWVNNGFSVIPIGYYSKKPIIKSWLPYQHNLPTHTELLEWFPSELRNIGLITGNGLVVIDFDVMDVFEFWNKQYQLKTFMVKTRRGVHVYLKTKQAAKNYHSDLLDIKAERGYVLIPPSVHPSGFQYSVLQEQPILTVESLSDVLPAEFTPAPELNPFTDTVEFCDDPWLIADQAGEFESNIVEKIRARISILSIMDCTCSSADGRWYVAFCPFHEDHNPSFWIDTLRGICGCRKCNIKEMDVINFYARLHGISNRQAIFDLQRKVGRA